MRFKVQLVVCAEDGQEDTVHELMVLDKPCQRLEHLSLTLAEAKQLLTPRPQPLVAQQVTACVATRSHCDHCGKTLGIKGHYTRPSAPSLARSR
jgi:hypothetical protein